MNAWPIGTSIVLYFQNEIEKGSDCIRFINLEKIKLFLQMTLLYVNYVYVARTLHRTHYQ